MGHPFRRLFALGGHFHGGGCLGGCLVGRLLGQSEAAQHRHVFGDLLPCFFFFRQDLLSLLLACGELLFGPRFC